MKNFFYSALFFILPLLLFGQKKEKQVLFTVDGEPVYTEAFKRMYQKNSNILEGESKMDIDTYLDLYIDYALKITEAKAQNLEDDPSFKNEYKKYHHQLVNKYVSETEVTEQLIQEAYQRMQTAVNASHILIRVAPHASPADTLEAYEQIMELRKKIIQGTPFETVATKHSEDPSVKKNAGKLGWFTVLKMVYPFETAAYQTKVGEISMPVRTNFGYHLIKVNDKRPSKGKVSVSHIMVVEKNEDSTFSPKKRIFELYEQLQEGASFEELAKNSKGGKLRPFSPGEMNAKKFGEVAFSLDEQNNISTPFQTKFGWHIVKLHEKHPIGSFEEVKNQLKEKIKKDSRARLINESLMNKLREKYNVETNDQALVFFENFVSDSILVGSWELDSTKIPSKILVQIKDENKTYLDFATYISKRQKRPSGIKNKKVLVGTWFGDFTDNFVLKYHKEHLEETNPEFAAIISEYYNGLLLFELMEQKIWNQAKTDSLRLQHYFEEHREKYSSKSLQEVHGKVVNDYQKQLEDEWMEKLHKKYKVDINRESVEELKEYFE